MSAGIHWDQIHQRLEASRSALEHGAAISAEEKQRILRERAASLAKERATTPARETFIEVVEFLLAHEKYAIESSCIREVFPLRSFTPIPATPPFIIGVINLRGEIISVVDIRAFFDLPQKGITDLNKVIIIRNAEMEFGILADAVLGSRFFAQNEIQPPLPTLTRIRDEYLRGITPDRTVILDAGKLLSDPKLIIQEEIET